MKWFQHVLLLRSCQGSWTEGCLVFPRLILGTCNKSFKPERLEDLPRNHGLHWLPATCSSTRPGTSQKLPMQLENEAKVWNKVPSEICSLLQWGQHHQLLHKGYRWTIEQFLVPDILNSQFQSWLKTIYWARVENRSGQPRWQNVTTRSYKKLISETQAAISLLFSMGILGPPTCYSAATFKKQYHYLTRPRPC